MRDGRGPARIRLRVGREPSGLILFLRMRLRWHGGVSAKPKTGKRLTTVRVSSGWGVKCLRNDPSLSPELQLSIVGFLQTNRQSRETGVVLIRLSVVTLQLHDKLLGLHPR